MYKFGMYATCWVNFATGVPNGRCVCGSANARMTKTFWVGAVIGCIEVGAFGKEAFVLTGYLNVPKIIEVTLNNGIDPVSEKLAGIKTGEPRDFKSYEELYDAFLPKHV